MLEGIQAEDCVNLVETVCVECVCTHYVLQSTHMFCTDTFLFQSLFGFFLHKSGKAVCFYL